MKNIRLRRMALRLTQSRLAKLSGVSRWKISDFENHYRSLSREDIERIESVLKQQMDEQLRLSFDWEGVNDDI